MPCNVSPCFNTAILCTGAHSAFLSPTITHHILPHHSPHTLHQPKRSPRVFGTPADLCLATWTVGCGPPLAWANRQDEHGLITIFLWFYLGGSGAGGAEHQKGCWIRLAPFIVWLPKLHFPFTCFCYPIPWSLRARPCRVAFFPMFPMWHVSNVFIRSDHYQTISVLWGLKNRYSYAPSFTSHALLGRWRVFFCGRFLGIFPQTHESFGLLTHWVWSVWFWAGRYA